MAKFTLTDVTVVLNVGGTNYDLSDHLDSVTVEYKKEVPDSTGMGSGGFRQRISGLKDWTMSLNFQQDFAAGSVDAAIYAGFMSDTNPTVTVKPKSSAVSATNPSYSGSCVVPNYTPLSGKVGDVSMMQVSLEGSGILTRATA